MTSWAAVSRERPTIATIAHSTTIRNHTGLSGFDASGATGAGWGGASDMGHGNCRSGTGPGRRRLAARGFAGRRGRIADRRDAGPFGPRSRKRPTERQDKRRTGATCVAPALVLTIG